MRTSYTDDEIRKIVGILFGELHSLIKGAGSTSFMLHRVTDRQIYNILEDEFGFEVEVLRNSEEESYFLVARKEYVTFLGENHPIAEVTEHEE